LNEFGARLFSANSVSACSLWQVGAPVFFAVSRRTPYGIAHSRGIKPLSHIVRVKPNRSGVKFVAGQLAATEGSQNTNWRLVVGLFCDLFWVQERWRALDVFFCLHTYSLLNE
jgi:hypothetical protein